MAGENEAQVQGDWPNRHSLHGPLDGGEVDRHRNWKRLGNYSAQAGTAGNVAAQGALHTGGIALVTGAVSATGIGLVVAGGALTLGNMAKGARSWRKTSKHLRGLSEIYRHGHEYECAPCPGAPADVQGIWHAYVLDKVLPYIIEQKEKKLFRKKVSTFGGGAAVSLYQVFHGARKAWQGHRGVVRGFYADVLATHLITHDCELADAIVDELYSEAECKVIKRMDSKPAGELLADKMRSG